MVGELLAIAAAYGSGICLMHLLYGRWIRHETVHVVFLTNHVGSSIEWHLRSFAFMNWLNARDALVTVLDEGSTDDTVRIAARLAHGSRLRWSVISVSSTEEAERWLEEAQGSIDHVIRLQGCSTASGTSKAAGLS